MDYGYSWKHRYKFGLEVKVKETTITVSTEEFKKEYLHLLDSGELFDFFPLFTGDWDKDGKYYISAMVGKDNKIHLKKSNNDK